MSDLDMAASLILDIIAVGTNVLLYMAPIPLLFWGLKEQKQKRKDQPNEPQGVIDLPPLPLTMQAASCIGWLTYTSLNLIWIGIIPNALGTLLSFPYLLSYSSIYKANLYSGQLKGQMIKVSVFVSIIMVLLLLSQLFDGKDSDAVVATIGWLCFSASVSFLTTPLQEFVRAICLQNVEVLGSLTISSMAMGCTVSWTIKGVFYLEDFPISIANGLGVLIHTIALCIRFYFRNAEPLPDAAYPEELAKMQKRYPCCLGNGLMKKFLAPGDTSSKAGDDAVADREYVSGVYYTLKPGSTRSSRLGSAIISQDLEAVADNKVDSDLGQQTEKTDDITKAAAELAKEMPDDAPEARETAVELANVVVETTQAEP
ncbi:unnamed protein product [Amoebophrya sp. A25]|nr:unnamed protein product [Amoebophrya sp. A25]|eukprot:GSA25T00008801001.1